jgi:hypothetical protein
MSYEGYVQCICSNGHYFNDDSSYGATSNCPTCKAPAAWENNVDETNCDSYGEINMESLIKVPRRTDKCNLGHIHEVAPAIYRIPTPRQTNALRCHRPGCGGTPLVPIKGHY